MGSVSQKSMISGSPDLGEWNIKRDYGEKSKGLARCSQQLTCYSELMQENLAPWGRGDSLDRHAGDPENVGRPQSGICCGEECPARAGRSPQTRPWQTLLAPAQTPGLVGRLGTKGAGRLCGFYMKCVAEPS